MVSFRLRISRRLIRRSIAALCCVAATAQAQSVPAQSVPARSASAQTATVRGIVFDSLAGSPLGNAQVQLVAADGTGSFGRLMVTDPDGQFVFDSIPDGRYTLGFFHPVLDSLGIEAPLRGVQISGQRPVTVGLSIPAAPAFRLALCGRPSTTEGNAVLLGFVRDARTREALTGVTVTVSWLELALGKGGTHARTIRRIARMQDNGWFALCQVPSPGTIQVQAYRGADSTDAVELQVPASGVLRQELSLGAARAITVNEPRVDSAARRDSLRPMTRIMYTGDGTLRGMVVGKMEGLPGGQPLVGAQVGLVNGPQTRTNARGEWTLGDLPRGTRTLEVRAVGYYPERRMVDVVDDAPLQTVSLVTFKSVLDTMKIRASANPLLTEGFLDRRRSTAGTFLTGNDIVVRTARVTSEIFRNLPGVYLEYPQPGDIDLGPMTSAGQLEILGTEPIVLMRSGAGVRCIPTIVLNGSIMHNLGSSDLDAMLSPQQLLGVEIYRPGQTPPQFQTGLSGCGSIVLWTRR